MHSLLPHLAMALLAGTNPAVPHPAETAHIAGHATQPSDGDVAEPDWSLLDRTDAGLAAIATPRRAPRPDEPAWPAVDRHGDTLTLKQPLPYAQTRVGIDMTIVRSPADRAARVPLPEKLASDARQDSTGGAAWAASTIGGPGQLWDSTDLETRLDPGLGEGALAARLTKSVPIGATRLTLRNDVRLTAPLGTGANTAEWDQSARLTLPDGLSLIAGHTHVAGDEHWRARLGAEQTMPGGLTLTGALSGTGNGTLAASVSAGFRTAW